MPAYVGTSGWMYRSWRGRFYPEGLPQRLWLEHYAQHFPTLELNNAFYRLPTREMFEVWRDRVPAGFVMAVKASRYLTHIKRLSDPAEPVERLLDHARGLGDRLGPVLLQLPPNLQVDVARLWECLACFPDDVRVAVEPRHESWWRGPAAVDVRKVLEERGAALCWADVFGRPVGAVWRTADWGYLRFHQGGAKPWPRYGRQALRSWSRRVADTWEAGADVYAYFNNDPEGAAPIDAVAFVEALPAGFRATQHSNQSS